MQQVSGEYFPGEQSEELLTDEIGILMKYYI